MARIPVMRTRAYAFVRDNFDDSHSDAPTLIAAIREERSDGKSLRLAVARMARDSRRYRVECFDHMQGSWPNGEPGGECPRCHVYPISPEEKECPECGLVFDDWHGGL